VCVLATGCVSEPVSVGHSERNSTTAGERSIGGDAADPASSFTMPNDVWAVVQQRCTWCHTPQHPTGGFDFTNRTQSQAVVRAIGYGVQSEMAPVLGRLTAADKSVLLDWVQRTTGPLPPVVVPARIHWEMTQAIAGFADGTTPPGFGFVVEDGWIDASVWKVASYTDRYGITGRGVALDQTHSVDQSIFPLSRNPSSYFFFKGIPWHGRMHDMRLEGDIRVDRWMSVGMQTAHCEPTGRANREYVRLQFDRDAISLRSAPKGPAFAETWPWGGSGSSPGADPQLTGTLDATGFYQRNDEWLHFVLTATRVAGGVRWTALVTRRGTGAVVASLNAMQASSTPLAGSFFLHAYAVGGKRNWANLVLDAEIDRDATPAAQPRPAPRGGAQYGTGGDPLATR